MIYYSLYSAKFKISNRGESLKYNCRVLNDKACLLMKITIINRMKTLGFIIITVDALNQHTYQLASLYQLL